MSLVNNLQFPPLLLFLRFSQVPNPPSHTNQTYFTLLYKINAQANTLRTLLCQERDRAREREEKKRGKNSTQFYALLVFLLLVFVSQKGGEVKDVEDDEVEERWVGEESKEKQNTWKAHFFLFFFYILFLCWAKYFEKSDFCNKLHIVCMI